MKYKIIKFTNDIIFFSLVGLICFGTMMMLEGYQHSISRYTLYPITAVIFKLWMLVLAIGAYRNRRLIYTIIPILGLLLFDSNPDIPIINILHNFSAVGFFGITTIIFLWHRDSRLFGMLMLLSYSVYFYDLFYGELITISIIYYRFIYKALKLNKYLK